MADPIGERAKGRCPECGRVISGRAVGIQRLPADRRFVALSPHKRRLHGQPVPCLTRGAYRVVPRIRPAG